MAAVKWKKCVDFSRYHSLSLWIKHLHNLMIQWHRGINLSSKAVRCNKSIAEQLGISRERVGSIIHEDLDMRKLSAKWVPKHLDADEKPQRRQSSEQLLEFFSYAIQMSSCRNWWPWTKPRYITMTRRQNNNQWSGGIQAHPAPPQKIPSAKIR